MILCPVHGSALCPEDYMLKDDGTPWEAYAHWWDESMRCGRRPVNPWGFNPFLARAIVALDAGQVKSEDIQDIVSAAHEYLNNLEQENV